MQRKKLKVLFSYTEKIVPKRCRIERPVRFEDGEVTFNIPAVTAEQAPVAIIENDGLEYRWWNKKLWTRGGHVLPDVIDRRSDSTFHEERFYPKTRSEKIKLLKENIGKRILIVDGISYVAAGEPRYYVITFGLGRNHGGTSLSCSYSYNENISKSSYFNLLQRDEAITAATKTAKNRGDTESLPITIEESFKILIPEAIQVNPRKQHGNGSAIINSLNALSEAVGGNNVIVGAAAIGLALSA